MVVEFFVGDSNGNDRVQIRINSCHGTDTWLYDSSTKVMKSRKSNLCLQGDASSIFLTKCVDGSKSQKWTFSEKLNA